METLAAAANWCRPSTGLGLRFIDRTFPSTVGLSLSKAVSRFTLLTMTSDWMIHCYLLRCADGIFYCGHTDDIEKRLAQHQSGHFLGHTFKRRPVKLVWNEPFQTRDDAKAAEKRIKGWSRAKKEALIARDWELLSQLAKNYAQHGRSDR